MADRPALVELISNPKHSVYRERLVEHLFIAEIMQAAWQQGIVPVISRTEFDGWGYDLAIEDGKGIARYLQLKTKVKGRSVTINGRLASLRGAAVVLILIGAGEDDRIRLKYRLYQNGASTPLKISGLKTAKYTRYVKASDGTAVRKERKTHYRLPLSRFTPPMGMDAVVKTLFSPPASNCAAHED